MGLSRVLLGLVVLFWSAHLPVVVLATMEELLEEVSGVQCRAAQIRFILPSDFNDFSSAFGVLGNAGSIHSLQNDPACGFEAVQKLDGSVEVSADYSGCYVRVEDEDYVMTLMIQYIVYGEVEHRKRDINCPVMNAMDAPSGPECAAISTDERMLCGNSTITKEACESLECCYFPRDNIIPCYFGKKVNAYCTSDNQFVVAISKEVTTPSFIPDLVHIIGVDTTTCPELRSSIASGFVQFQMPLSCGRRQVSENTIAYEMDIEAKVGVTKVLITRDSPMRLTVRCRYSKTGVVPLMVEVFTPSAPPPVSTTGPLNFELRIAKDAQYTSYYQDLEYPVIKILRDPIYLEVHIREKTDPNLVLVLNHCWATPSEDPTQETIWPVIVDGCPYKDEDLNYFTQLSSVGSPSKDVPYPSHYERFIVRTFVFVDKSNSKPLAGLVFFHCSASVCTPSAVDSCSRSCSNPGKRKRRDAEEPIEVMVTKGPVVFKSDVMRADVTIPNPRNAQGLEMKNKSIEPAFIGAKEPMDDIADGGRGGLPKRVEGPQDPHLNTMMWLRGAAVGGCILALLVTVVGVCRCQRNRRHPRMHSVTA